MVVNSDEVIPAQVYEPIAATINIDDFAKIDLRIALIKDAQAKWITCLQEVVHLEC